MNLNLQGVCVVSEYTPTQMVSKTGVVSLFCTPSKIVFPASDKEFSIKEIPVTDVKFIGDRVTRDTFRGCLRKPNLTKPPLFKAYDNETDITMMLTIWNKKLFLIAAPISQIYDCITGTDTTYGITSTRTAYIFIQGKFSYNGAWCRFMTTYPDIENVLPMYDGLEDISTNDIFGLVEEYQTYNYLIEEIVYKHMHTGMKTCKAMCIIDDEVWVLYRRKLHDPVMFAKLHDILISRCDWHERDPDEQVVSKELPAPLTLQDKFDKLKNPPKKKAEPVMTLISEDDIPKVKEPNASIKLPQGAAVDFCMSPMDDDVVTALLANVNPSNVILGLSPGYTRMKSARADSSGMYHLTGYGLYGRAEVSGANLETLKCWTKEHRAIEYQGNIYNLYYDNVSDPTGLYVLGLSPSFEYHSSQLEMNEQTETQPTQPTQSNEATQPVKETETMTTTITTDVTIEELTDNTQLALKHLQEDLNLKVIGLSLTSAEVHPLALSGFYTITNAGPFTGLVVGTPVENASPLSNIEDGIMVTTPTVTFLGTEKGVYKFDTAIIVPKEQEVIEKEVIKEVKVELTTEELVTAILDKVKTGEVPAMELIGKVTTAL